ncbi:MAG: hypothetical protein ACRCYY_08755 [Trueperaceae bacterium]
MKTQVHLYSYITIGQTYFTIFSTLTLLFTITSCSPKIPKDVELLKRFEENKIGLDSLLQMTDELLKPDEENTTCVGLEEAQEGGENYLTQEQRELLNSKMQKLKVAMVCKTMFEGKDSFSFNVGKYEDPITMWVTYVDYEFLPVALGENQLYKSLDDVDRVAKTYYRHIQGNWYLSKWFDAY